MATVALLGTCDTKLQELLYLRSRILSTNQATSVILIDCGRRDTHHEHISINQSLLLSAYGGIKKDVSDLPRGDLIKLMAECATKAVKELYDQKAIDGIIAAGGSGGTSLAAVPMREALPIGFPKMIVSTVASGDTGPLVGETDITMMYSVVDVAGVNGVLRDILRNAGVAIAAAALSYHEARNQPAPEEQGEKKHRVGITMFGVTTPGVDAIRYHLESNYPIETYVFHATGHGGKAMERLIREGNLDAVLDLTTTEICDFITGGVMSAGPSRLDAAIEAGIPTIISLGATDMTNFGPRPTVPPKYQDRNLYEHNPVVTLMRTSKDEAREVAEFICKKVKRTEHPDKVQLWMPLGGISMIAKQGDPFYDGEADEVMFGTIRERLGGSGIEVVEDKRDVNDEGFARDIAEAMVKLMGIGK